MPSPKKREEIKMAILPTKNELKDVSLEALETYKAFLEEEITVRRQSEKRKQCEEVMKLLNQAFDLAVKYNISLNVTDVDGEMDVEEVRDIDIHNAGNTIIIDLFR